ncbi:sideroflexin-4 isoform X1 [Entelurus aequoreus]|uniref:sideroflexin-4 isoform X1 n=1 Tax=Entelurus aequoreus TaxID=161455 RepID=UPI002B1D2A70|nr:sideroflexin-4 isoform X1 [Entelurus aequoreus]
MDVNLLYWKCHGQSFFSRFKIWANLLNPSSLVTTDAEIQQVRALLGSGEKVNKEDEHEWTIALSSVHADSGSVLPLFFRPPAFLPLSLPLVVGSILPHISVKSAVFWQFLLHSYTAGFNHANRNSSSEKQGKAANLNQRLLIAGTVSYAACAGALPQIFVNRLGLTNPGVQKFFRFFIPIPLSAALAFFNVYIVRGEEFETGIQVFDSNGNPIGFSKAAAKKAVMETAWSRAALFGTAIAVPNLLVAALERTRPFKKNTMLVASIRHISVALVFGLMIPLSFSLFPQLGMIKTEHVEKELQAKAVKGCLFYHRGL